MSIAEVNRVWNIVDLCRRYSISAQDIRNYIQDKSIDIVEKNIPISGTKSAPDWPKVQKQTQLILEQKFTREQLRFLVPNKKIAKSIAKGVHDQIVEKYNNQSRLTYWTSNTVSDNLFFCKTWKTTVSPANGRSDAKVEYLKVSATGTIVCGQQALRENNLSLNLQVTCHAITVDLEMVAWDKGIDANQFIAAISWRS